MIYIPQVILAHKVVPGKGCPKIDLFKVAFHLQWQREYKQLCRFILTCSFFMKRQVSFVLLNPISRLCVSNRKHHKRRRQCRQFFGQLVMTNNAISMALGFLKNSSVNITISTIIQRTRWYPQGIQQLVATQVPCTSINVAKFSCPGLGGVYGLLWTNSNPAPHITPWTPHSSNT